MPAPAQPVVLRARNGVRDNAGTAFHLLVTHRIVADVAINVHSTRPVRVASVPAGPGTARVWDSASIPPLSSATTRTAAVAETHARLARVALAEAAGKPGPSATRIKCGE